MRTEIVVVKDFYQDPGSVAEYAYCQKFYNPWFDNLKGSSAPEYVKNALWLASFWKKATTCPFKSSPFLISALEEITGEEIDLEYWNKDFPENFADGTVISPRPDVIDPTKEPRWDNLDCSCRWNCVFHVKLHKQSLGEGVHNHVTDAWNSVGEAGWAGTIYLNKDAPRDSGLKLWENKHGDNFEWMTDKGRWELSDDFANVYNRLILCRGNLPHSGGSGFGDSLRTGRLFQTFFFKTKGPKSRVANLRIGRDLGVALYNKAPWKPVEIF